MKRYERLKIARLKRLAREMTFALAKLAQEVHSISPPNARALSIAVRKIDKWINTGTEVDLT